MLERDGSGPYSHPTAAPCNVLRQERNQSLAEIPRYNDGPRRVRFTHIINPYRGQAHDTALQELTFETIRIAARVASPALDVRCVCVTVPDDLDIVPADFTRAGTLRRTVADIAEFTVPRTLPLVFDILDLGIAVPEHPPELPDCEDYIIFTNIDIHLQPCFYLAASEFIRAGYDILDIHRRNIPHVTPSVDRLAGMFAEEGVHHGGMDCVVFPRRKYKSFIRNNACVGMSLVMKGMIFNCALQAKRFLIVSNAHLTFHLGNDRAWAVSRFKDYEHFNSLESKRVINSISKDKTAAVRLISTLRTMHVDEQFIVVAEKTAGVEHPKAKAQRRLVNLINRACALLLRKAISFLSRREESRIRN